MMHHRLALLLLLLFAPPLAAQSALELVPPPAPERERMHTSRDRVGLYSATMLGEQDLMQRMDLSTPVDVLEYRGNVALVALAREPERVGWIHVDSLRLYTTPGREALMASAIREWIYFGRSTIPASADSHYQRIAKYWQVVNRPTWDGRTGLAWSAAFISFVVHQTGLYPDFRFATGHSYYIDQARQARLAGDTTAGFWAYDLLEVEVELGDLVCRWAQVPQDIRTSPRAHPAHCDVVVEDHGGWVVAIGGNLHGERDAERWTLTSTVGLAWPATWDGYVLRQDAWYAVLKNRR